MKTIHFTKGLIMVLLLCGKLGLAQDCNNEKSLNPDPQSSNYINNGCYSVDEINTNTDNIHNTPQLDSPQGWSAKNTSQGNYVGMLFDSPSAIKSVSTKGRANLNEWVTTYRLLATKDGTTWSNLGDFTGNSDRNTLVSNPVNNTDKDWIGVRIQPLAWNGHPTLRFQITLCGPENHGTVEVNYPDGVNLPDNAALGVNGRMLIYNGSKSIDNVTFNSDIVNNFALVVAGDQAQAEDEEGNLLFDEDDNPIMENIGGGIVARDLGIGASNLYMSLADYVFAEDYALPALEETKAYVQEHKHLPAIIGEDELSAKGYFRVDRMLFGQLKHLEELLLHTIEQEEQIKAQEEENERLRQLAEKLEERLNVLESKKI